MRFFLHALPAALLLTLPVAAYAQAPGIADTAALARPQNLAPIEVRAVRASADAPFAKTEISGAALQRDNLGQDLPVLLQYTPSAVVTSDAGAGIGYTGLRIRGSDATRINVTLNGIAVNDAESQSTYFVDLPDIASSTASIQIQRGAGSSTNGAGAFGGTLSISALGVYDKAGAEAAISYGSFNTQKYTVQAGTGFIDDRFALNVRLSQITSDGFIDRSASKLQSLQVSGAYKLGPNTTIRGILLQGAETTHQAWDGVPQDSLATNRTYNELGQKADGSFYDNQIDYYRQNYYQLFADHRFSRRVQAHLGLFLTRGIGYYEEYHTGEDFAAYGLPPVVSPGGDTTAGTDLIRQLWLDNYNYGAVYSAIWAAAKGLSLTFGGGASQYTGNHYGYITWAQTGVPDHYRYYKLDAQKNDFDNYIKAEYRVARKLLLYGDLQYRTVGYFMNGFRNNPDLRPAVTYNFFNPKAGVTYTIRSTSKQRQKAYASFAIANKEPNRDDFEAALNALPKPERLYDAELGYEIATGRWSAAVNGYYMHYRDQLVLTGQINDVGAYTRTNVAESHRAGVELQAAYQAAGWLSIQGNATFSESRIKDFAEYLDNYDATGQIIAEHHNTHIAFSPRIIAAGGLSVSPFEDKKGIRAFAIEVLGKYVGKQYLDNTSSDLRSITDYGLCDVRLRYNPAPRAGHSIGFSLLLNNVLDKHYQSNGATYPYYSGGAPAAANYYFPQAGFNWLLGVQLKW